MRNHHIASTEAALFTFPPTVPKGFGFPTSSPTLVIFGFFPSWPSLWVGGGTSRRLKHAGSGAAVSTQKITGRLDRPPAGSTSDTHLPGLRSLGSGLCPAAQQPEIRHWGTGAESPACLWSCPMAEHSPEQQGDAPRPPPPSSHVACLSHGPERAPGAPATRPLGPGAPPGGGTGVEGSTVLVQQGCC